MSATVFPAPSGSEFTDYLTGVAPIDGPKFANFSGDYISFDMSNLQSINNRIYVRAFGTASSATTPTVSDITFTYVWAKGGVAFTTPQTATAVAVQGSGEVSFNITSKPTASQSFDELLIKANSAGIFIAVYEAVIAPGKALTNSVKIVEDLGLPTVQGGTDVLNASLARAWYTSGANAHFTNRNTFIFNGTSYVSNSPSGYDLKSENLINWNLGSFPFASGSRFFKAGDYFVAMPAYNSAATSTYRYSLDGITWTAGNFNVSDDWAAITFGNGLYWAVADGTQMSYASNIAGPWTSLSIEIGRAHV